MLLAGESPGAVARILGLPEGTVKNWARALKQSGLVAAAVDTVAPQALEELGDLVMRNLRAGLASSEALKKLAMDRVWQMRQPADQVAKLIDTIDTKNIRLIEAMERASPTPKVD